MKNYLRDHFDFWSLVVIVLTFALFIVALFIKGLTHEILLEAGVFLVSLKLIMMSHKNSVLAKKTEFQLERILKPCKTPIESPISRTVFK